MTEEEKIYLPWHPRNVIIRAGNRYVYVDVEGTGTIFEKEDLPYYIKGMKHVTKMRKKLFKKLEKRG